MTQVQEAQAKAPVSLVMRQRDQPVGDLIVLAAELRLVSIATFTDAKHPAGQADADVLFHDGFTTFCRWLP